MAPATHISNPTLRRLMKEAHELSAASSSPSPYFYAHPVSESDVFDWHFTIAGPPAPSPYADGIYHGRIVLPHQYPLRPPSFRFLTPSGRFEVNREICLSISGHHEETWQPAWGIRTALTALRTLMEGDAKGQVGGVEAGQEVRREWARRSRSWKCDACSGEKTNEAAMREWREMCLGKGVTVDEEGDGNEDGVKKDSVPAGLRFGYKDKDGRVGDTGAQNEVSSSAPDTGNSAPSSEQPVTGRQDAGASSSHSSSLPSPSPTGVMTPSTSSTAIPDQPSSASTTTQPSRTIPQTGTQSTTQTSRHASQDSTAWMDRAIPALGVALVIMILKNWILPYVL